MPEMLTLCGERAAKKGIWHHGVRSHRELVSFNDRILRDIGLIAVGESISIGH
jgi:uncharacterized protein YjiS (DUF1127 family)